jgi:hypothetical protein
MRKTILHAFVVLATSGLLSACPRPTATPDGSIDVYADASSEQGDAAIVLPDASDAGMSSPTILDPNRWSCVDLPAERPSPFRTRTDGGCGSDCTVISDYQPGYLSEDLDVVEHGDDVGVLRHRIGSSERVQLGDSYALPDRLLPPVSADAHSYLVGGTRRAGARYALAVSTSNSSQRYTLIFEVDRASGRACPRYAESYAIGRNIPGGIGGLTRLDRGYVWRASTTEVLYDAFYLPDGERTPIRLTDCGCLKQLTGHSGVAWMSSEDVRTGASALWVFVESERRARRIWAPPDGSAVSRIRVDAEDSRRVSLNIGRGQPFCPTHMDIAVASLEDLDAGRAPRMITNDSATQSTSAMRGRWVAYTDYSRDTITPNGCPDDDHNRTDLVLYDLETDTRRVVNTDTTPMSPLLIGRESIYVLHWVGLGTVALPR